MTEQTSLSTALDRAILKAAKFDLNKEYRVGWEDPETKKVPIMVKLRDMNLDDLRKALAKVKAMKASENGEENKGRRYWESSIILALKVRSALEEILKDNEAYNNAIKTIDKLEATIEKELVEATA